MTSAPGDNKVTSSSSDLRVITSPVDNRLTGSKRVIARVSPAIKPPLSPASDKQDTRTRRPRSQLPRKGKSFINLSFFWNIEYYNLFLKLAFVYIVTLNVVHLF